MATHPKTAKAAAPADPVNSEQLEMQEAAIAPAAAPGATSVGELEERTVEAEQRAEAAETRVLTLEQEMAILREQMKQLLKVAKTPRPAAEAAGELLPGEIPVFDEEMPHGVVTGDGDVAYVQNGHQFGRDRKYLATEPHRGTPRAFNPRMVGWVKPKPGHVHVDALDGFRPQT